MATKIRRTRPHMRSTQTRQRYGDSNGVRRIDRSAMQSSSSNDKGIIQKIIDWGKGVVDWAISKVMAFIQNINLEKIAEWGIALFEGIWQFNWDVSDSQIDKTIISLQGQLISRTTGLLGRTLGTLICGALPTAAIAYFNPSMAMHVAMTKGPEVLNDLANEYGSFAVEAYKNYQKQRLWTAYKNVRKVLKTVLNHDNPISNAIAATIPGGKATVQGWGDEQVNDWSFQSQRQKQREKLPEEWTGDMKTFWNQDSSEEFFDEFSDACKEAIIALAQGLDDYIGIQRMNESQNNQMVRTTINLKKGDENGEKITVFSRIRDMATSVTDVLNQRQLLDNRDMGSFIGQPWDEAVITEGVGIQLTLVFYNFEEPPYWTKERRSKLKKTEIVLPNVKRSMVDWDKLKDAFGRKSPFEKGSVKGEINLANGRKFAFYAKDDNDVTSMVEAIEPFLDTEVIYPIKFGEMKGRGKDKTKKYIDNERMYVSHCYILNWKQLDKYMEAKGLGTEENYRDPRKRKAKIPLYMDKKPSWVDDIISEVVSNTLETVNPGEG